MVTHSVGGHFLFQSENSGEHDVSDDQSEQRTHWRQSGQPQFGCNRAIYFSLQEQVPIEAHIRAAFEIGVY